MRQVNQRIGLLSILFTCAFTATNSPAPGETPGTGDNSNQREVMLISQDFSDCSNGNVSAGDPGQRGIALVARGADGITRVKVAMTVTPNTTYHFFLKCVRQLGDITTQDEGEGFGTFEFPTNSVGNVYAFDMYPEGAPPGNKFQSVQVKF